MIKLRIVGGAHDGEWRTVADDAREVTLYKRKPAPMKYADMKTWTPEPQIDSIIDVHVYTRRTIRYQDGDRTRLNQITFLAAVHLSDWEAMRCIFSGDGV